MKENSSKSLRHCSHRNKLLFIKKFVTFLDFCHVKCGRHVHNGNVVVQQLLSASSVISAACVSIAVVYICKKKLLTQKLVDSKFCHC